MHDSRKKSGRNYGLRRAPRTRPRALQAFAESFIFAKVGESRAGGPFASSVRVEPWPTPGKAFRQRRRPRLPNEPNPAAAMVPRAGPLARRSSTPCSVTLSKSPTIDLVDNDTAPNEPNFFRGGQERTSFWYHRVRVLGWAGIPAKIGRQRARAFRPGVDEGRGATVSCAETKSGVVPGRDPEPPDQTQTKPSHAKTRQGSGWNVLAAFSGDQRSAAEISDRTASRDARSQGEIA